MTDLYAQLGIDKNADKAEIRKAYKRKAKKAHPDTGGSKEKFGALKKAHDILLDDDRRAKYDSTGDESEKQPDNALSAAIGCIGFHFNAVLHDCAKNGESPLEVDMVVRINRKINSSIEEIYKQIRINKNILETDKKIKGRFKKKKKDDSNIFENIIISRIMGAESYVGF